MRFCFCCIWSMEDTCCPGAWGVTELPAMGTGGTAEAWVGAGDGRPLAAGVRCFWAFTWFSPAWPEDQFHSYDNKAYCFYTDKKYLYNHFLHIVVASTGFFLVLWKKWRNFVQSALLSSQASFIATCRSPWSPSLVTLWGPIWCQRPVQRLL